MSYSLEHASNPVQARMLEQVAVGDGESMQNHSLPLTLSTSDSDRESIQVRNDPESVIEQIPAEFDMLAALERKLDEYDLPPIPLTADTVAAESTAQQQQASVDTITEWKPFNCDVPLRSMGSPRCAFRLDGDNILLGKIYTSPMGWEPSLRINAGRIQDPYLMFELRAALEPKGVDFKRGTAHDVIRMLWYPANPTFDGQMMIPEFTHQRFDEWNIQSVDESLKKAFREETDFDRFYKRTFTIKCTLQKAIIQTDFANKCSMMLLPEDIRIRIYRLRDQTCSVRFWIRIINLPSETERHLTLFSERICGNIGILSQYWDGQGKPLFNSIDTSPTIGEFHQVDSTRQTKARIFTPCPKLMCIKVFNISWSSRA